MANYTIKETEKYTFQVIDENGNQVGPEHLHQMHAKWAIEDLERNAQPVVTDEEATDLTNSMFDENDRFIPGEEPVKVEEVLPETVCIDGQQEIGSMIEFQGQQWTVTRSEYYSAKDQWEDENGGMGSLNIGWHSWLARKEQ